MEVEVTYRDTNGYNQEIWHKKECPHYYHREDGPAYICNNEESWIYHCKLYKSEEMPLSLYIAYLKWELKKHGK